MTIADKTVLVTGANRGIGQALVADALRRGARRVYAGTRQPLAHPDGRVTPLTLDVTNPAQIQAAAEQVDALDLLINNAGIWLYDDLSDRAMLEEHLAVNFYGTWGVTQAFLPLLTRSKGTIVNNVSLMALAALPLTPAYSASKAAAFSLTQSLRALLAGRGVRVHAVLTGPVDTDMTRSLDIPKASPASVARAIFDGVENGEEDIFPDPMSALLADGWRDGVAKALERQNAALAQAQPVTASEGRDVDAASWRDVPAQQRLEGRQDAMTEHKVVGRAEWQAARDELLQREKAHTRMGDELALQRRELPWVAIDKDYRIDTDDGPRTLAELFDGRSQLLVYHFMFGPSYQAGDPVNSSIADSLDALLPHLQARDVTLVLMSRAPLAKLQAYRRRMGWRVPWVSSANTDFNLDLGASSTGELTPPDGLPPIVAQNAAAAGTDVVGYLSEAPVVSVFTLQDGVVYQTYATTWRGVEFLMGYYPILDRMPKGRDEGDAWQTWLRRHDEYNSQ